MRMTTLKNVLVPTQNQRGIALVVALLVTTLLLVIGTHFMFASLSEKTVSSNEVEAARAFYAAEGGMEHAKKSLEGLDFSGVLAGTDDVFQGKGKGKGKGVGSSAVVVGATYTIQVSNNILANGFPRGTIPADLLGSDIVDGDDIIVLTSTGTFRTGQQTVETVLQSEGSFPSIPGAVVQVSNGWNDLDVGGTISGFDESKTCTDQAGDFHRGTTFIQNGGTVTGTPPERAYDPALDDKIWNDPKAVVDMVEKWMNDPAAVTIKGKTPPTQLGTAAKPQITVWDPPSTDTDQGAPKFTGYGILIMVGRVNLKTAFEFHGLIVAYGKKELAIEGGNGQVLHGAILAANDDPSPGGEATEVGVLNGAKVNYNCAALKQYAEPFGGGASGALKVLSWRQR